MGVHYGFPHRHALAGLFLSTFPSSSTFVRQEQEYLPPLRKSDSLGLSSHILGFTHPLWKGSYRCYYSLSIEERALTSLQGCPVASLCALGRSGSGPCSRPGCNKLWESVCFAKVQLRVHCLSTALPRCTSVPWALQHPQGIGEICITLGSLVLSVFSTSWGQIYALLCFALPVFITKPTKTLFVLQSKSPMTWDPYFWARGELKTWVCQIICGTCWWQMVYKHLFSYYSRRENSWESKSFLIFFSKI